MGENPFYRFFRRVSFPLDYKIWRKMPRHPSFKHEYWDGKLHWTPRPNTCDVYLDLDQWRKAMRPNTKTCFVESPTNPTLDVLDIGAIADIAHQAGARLIVDNVFATPIWRGRERMVRQSATPASSLWQEMAARPRERNRSSGPPLSRLCLRSVCGAHRQPAASICLIWIGSS